MAVQNPFFGKRESEAFQPRNSVLQASNLGGASLAASPAAQSSAAAKSYGEAEQISSASKLTVGPNIKLKGVEITDCDTLVVEGTVEASMDSRLMQIAPEGKFSGTAEIDVAEIHGVFEGTLTVRQKLVIFSTGRVSGTIQYGKVVIEEGGQLSGQITTIGQLKALEAPAASLSPSAFSSPSANPASTSAAAPSASASATNAVPLKPVAAPSTASAPAINTSSNTASTAQGII